MTVDARPARVPAPRARPDDRERTVEDRVAVGRAARRVVPRSSHAEWAPAADRPDPVEVLVQQAAWRLPDLLPIRYGRMAVSPFAFYRGAAAVMTGDLARTPVSGLRAQLCGDAHLANFGAFASPERTLVFDLNDFDETSPGPWEWDLKRLVASFEVSGRETGLGDADRRDVVATAARAYREAMAGFATMSNLGVWYARLDVAAVVARWREQVDAKLVRRVDKRVARAYGRDSAAAAAKLTRRVDGRLRFVSDPPLLVPLRDLAGDAAPADLDSRLRAIVHSYRRSLPVERRHLLDGYRVVDAARKVVGVGSVGTRCWIVLLTGRDDSDVLVLQVKEAAASVLAPYVTRSTFSHQGQRVVEGQRLMQATGDILLGWDRIRGFDDQSRDAYVRQLWDGKASAEVSLLRPQGLRIYARLCGWTLARAHARSGDRVAIAAYLGVSDAMDRALVGFAQAYADQTETDHTALRAAIAADRVAALDGV